jgi:endothelin-converting enzyme
LAKSNFSDPLTSGDPAFTHHPITVEDFAKLFPTFDYRRYISDTSPLVFPAKLNVDYPLYFSRLNDVLLSDLSSEVLQNYFATKVVLYFAQYLDPESILWDTWQTIRKIVTGLSDFENSNRKSWCVNQMEDAMGFAVGRFFAKRKFTGKI